MVIDKNDLHPITYAGDIRLKFEHALSRKEIETRIIGLLTELTSLLKDNGCKLIGHIKALLDAGSGGKLFFSVTSFDRGVQCKGDLLDKIQFVPLFSIDIPEFENIS